MSAMSSYLITFKFQLQAYQLCIYRHTENAIRNKVSTDLNVEMACVCMTEALES